MFLDAGGYRHAAGVEEPNPDPATIKTVRAVCPGGFFIVWSQELKGASVKKHDLMSCF